MFSEPTVMFSNCLCGLTKNRRIFVLHEILTFEMLEPERVALMHLYCDEIYQQETREYKAAVFTSYALRLQRSLTPRVSSWQLGYQQEALISQLNSSLGLLIHAIRAHWRIYDNYNPHTQTDLYVSVEADSGDKDPVQALEGSRSVLLLVDEEG